MNSEAGYLFPPGVTIFSEVSFLAMAFSEYPRRYKRYISRTIPASIEVYFEKENIWTLDSKGELLITIMSSLAQEESRSISENVTWGHRKRFSDGKFSLAYEFLFFFFVR